MRRLLCLLFLSAVIAAPVAEAASARENGRGRGERAERSDRSQRGGWSGAQQGGRGGREPGLSREDRGRGARSLPAAARGREDNPGRGAGRQDRQDREPPARRYRDAPQGDTGRYGRGDYLYEPEQGRRVPDPGRLRLREAPPGYDWMSVGGDIVLRQRSTGRIVESIPGGDAPPPRGQR